jgi:uncharacterized coiled-coil protein SlyX
LVETAIYVGLGALATALLALLALPAVSRRAFRLAQARLRLTAPPTGAEAEAERDALRGKHAVELALVERRADAAGERWAEAQIALGRQAAEIVARDAALEERAQEIARQRAEIAGLVADLRARDAEIGAGALAMHDFLGQRDDAQRRFAASDALRLKREAEIEALSGEINLARRRAESEGLAAQARIAELQLRLDETQAEVSRLRRQAAELTDRLRDRTEEAAARENDLSARIASLSAAQAETETALRAARAGQEDDARLRELIVKLGRAWARESADATAE